MKGAGMATVGVGDFVRDKISELEGIAVARTVWVNGCIRVTFQPIGSKDGKPYETVTVDEEELTVLDAAGVGRPAPNSGPRDDAAALRR